MRLLYTFILFAFLSNLFALADDVKSHTLKDTIVVTAERHSKNIADIAGSVSVLSRDKINLTNPNSVPDALLSTSGVFMQKTNHGGGSPFVRGLTGQQVLILIDGIRLNNSTTRSGPNQYLNTIDINTIQRVEIYKGQGSVEYGSDAIGGTLNLITRKPYLSDDYSLHFSSDLSANYMTSDMEKSVAANFNLGTNNIAMLGSVSYSDFGDLIGGDTTGIQSPSGYKQFNGNFSLSFKPNAASLLNFTSQFVNQTDIPLYHKVILDNYEYNFFDPQMRFLNYIQYTHNFNNILLNNISITLFNTNSAEGRISKKNNSTTERRENDKIFNVGFTALATSIINSYWNMTTGLENYFDRVNSTREDINIIDKSSIIKRGLYPDNSTFNNFAAFNFHNINISSLNIDLGVRYDAITIHIPEETLGNILFTTNSLVWKAAINKKIAKFHTIGAIINKSFRAPNIDDLGSLGIVDFRYEIPSNNLSPEVSINYELNHKYIKGNIWTEFSLYYNHLSDFIQRIRGNIDGKDSIDGYPIYIKKNTASAFIQGAEVFVKYLPTNNIILEGFITYTYGVDIISNDPMRRIPPLNGLLAINYIFSNNYNIKAEYLFAFSQDRLAKGDISDNRIGKDGTDGWNVINIFANYNYKTINITLGLYNLLDVDYRYHGSGINSIGRSGKIGMKYSIN